MCSICMCPCFLCDKPYFWFCEPRIAYYLVVFWAQNNILCPRIAYYLVVFWTQNNILCLSGSLLKDSFRSCWANNWNIQRNSIGLYIDSRKARWPSTDKGVAMPRVILKRAFPFLDCLDTHVPLNLLCYANVIKLHIVVLKIEVIIQLLLH